jgi:hypothetical protein
MKIKRNKIYEALIYLFDIKIDEVEREEAALIFLEKSVEFKWRPQIVQHEICSNVVDFSEISKKVKKKNK